MSLLVVVFISLLQLSASQKYNIETNEIEILFDNFNFWSDWSNWSTCIPSLWGGLQTRERLCNNLLGEVRTGQCEGRGSDSRTCSKVVKGFRVRKNIRTLTDNDLHDLIQGFTKFKADKSPMGYHNIVNWHGWPYECPWYKNILSHEDGHCSWHEHPMFFAWHRLFTVQLELGLSVHLKDKTLGIPYWDWTEPDWENLPELFLHQEIYDPKLKEKVHNPFYETIISDDQKFNNQSLKTYRSVSSKGIHNYKLMLRSVIQALTSDGFAYTDKMLENSHNQIHVCICQANGALGEECMYSMLQYSYSAFDPVFLMHHSQVDRLYTLYKEVHEEANDLDWTKSSFLDSYNKSGIKMTPDILNSFDWPLSPFCNTTMNVETITSYPSVWTVRNSFYSKQLFGYTYDSLDIGGYQWQGLVDDILDRKKSKQTNEEYAFRSHSAPNMGVISTLNTNYRQKCMLTEK